LSAREIFDVLASMDTYYVYILANKRYGTLYVGFTNDLIGRTYQHREGLVEGFTKIYGVKLLVYFETYSDPLTAIAREKKLKRWRRDWKIALIERDNPYWQDLYPGLLG
jgi:putative endonuclease